MLKTSKYQFHHSNQCFVISGDHLSWYEARNRCIEGSGDLASLEDVDTFMAFLNFTSAMKEKFGISFIGLQKNWWTWRSRGTFSNIILSY